MNKIVSLDMLHRTPTAGFYQTKTVSFNGGYYELYINRTQDIPNEVIVHQERSALAVDYFNYYFNPTIKISVICNDNGNDVVIDQLDYESSNEPKVFKFCNFDHHLVFNGTELEIISQSCNAPQSYPINQVEIKWYISQTSLFNSVDELVRILKPYKCNANNFSNLIKSDNCPHPYYFEEWEGIVRLINYYENRYSFTPNNNVSILPFVNFSMHLFDDCFGQDKGGGAYVPLFLNNMNSTHFFVDF